MEGSETTRARRIINLLGYLGIVIVFVSGLFLGGAPQYVSIAGGVLVLAAWVYAIITAVLNKQMDWVIVLATALLIGVFLAFITLTDNTPDADSVPQMGGLAIGFLAVTYASLGGGKALARGFPAFTGAWGLLTLVVGGTLVGGAIGTHIGAAAPYITTVGFHLYAIAGVLALYAWIVGLVLAIRTGAWGWLASVILLSAVGAFMFGLFGPTRQDVLMSRENARQRKAAGLG